MTNQRTDWPLPVIDLARCRGCGVCVDCCPTCALDLQGGHAVIAKPERCTFCEVCERYCPYGAIARPFVIRFAPPDESQSS